MVVVGFSFCGVGGYGSLLDSGIWLCGCFDMLVWGG